MIERPLLVPIRLEALIIGQDSAPLADFTPNYEYLSRVPFGKSVMNGYFATKPELSIGAHLHWILPDALLSGLLDADGKLRFPQLPNRWILQRIGVSDGDASKIDRKVWLIESDFITNETAQTPYGLFKTTVPDFKLTDGEWVGAGQRGELFAYIGDCREYGTAPSCSGAYLDELTAIGFGDHLFSAYYPRCKTVFGFYDDMSGIQSGVFTYVLTGYYENKQNDPLCGHTKDTLKELAWKLADDTVVPDGILCHSMLSGVKWDGATASYQSGVPAGDVGIVMGNTSAEVLSLLLQEKMPTVQGLERVLNALQYNKLRELDDASNPDALLEFEEVLHEKQFSARGDGSIWILRKTGDDIKTATLDNEIYQKLQTLNDRQILWDSESARSTALQNEIYFAWWKFVLIYTSPLLNDDEVPDFIPRGDEAEASAKDFLKLIDKLAEDLSVCKNSIQSAQKDIESLSSELCMDLKQKNFTVEKSNADRAYTANDPVLMLHGEGVQRAFKQGFQTAEDGVLPCRVHSLTEFSVPVDGGETPLNAGDILSVCTKARAKLPDIIESLLAEAVFLDSGFARLIAVRAYEKQQKEYTEAQLQALCVLIKDRQAKAEGYTGTQPYREIAVNPWKQPWTPLLMEWQAEMLPARTNMSKDDTLDSFYLDETDFVWKASGLSGQAVGIQGSTLLTPHAVIRMYGMLIQLIEDYGESGKHYKELKQAAESIKTMNVLSQRMNGFSEAMIMRADLPYVPVCKLDSKTAAAAKKVAACLEGSQPCIEVGQNAAKFLPVRGGFMNVSKIWLVDSFGQIKRLKTSSVSVSENMRSDNPAYQALLRPRFIQTCASRFLWRDHAHEERIAADAGSSPVFGYAIPNFLDCNLQIHDERGALLGFVQQTDHGSKWMSPPGGSGGVDDIPCEHLKFFAKGLIDKTAALGEFLIYLNNRYSRMSLPVKEQLLQMCFGKVIALARATAEIYGKGFPPYVQWFGDELNSLASEREEFMLRLGDPRKAQDGLIGFFTGGAVSQTYDSMYVCPGIAGGKSQYLVDSNTVKTTLANGPVPLSVLMEPAGYITVRTGLLPASRAELNPDFFIVRKGTGVTNTIEELEMMFRLAPLLTAKESFEALLPGAMENTWSFLYENHDRQIVEINDIQNPALLPPASRQRIAEGFLKTKAQKKGGANI